MTSHNTKSNNQTNRNVRFGAFQIAENNIKKSIQEQGFFNFLSQMNKLPVNSYQRLQQPQQQQQQLKQPAIPTIPRLMGRSVGKFGVAGAIGTILTSLISGRGLKGAIGDLAGGGIRTLRKAAIDKARLEAAAKRRNSNAPVTPAPPQASETPAEKARREGEARKAAIMAARQASINAGTVQRTRGDTSGYDVSESKKYGVKYLKSKYYK